MADTVQKLMEDMVPELEDLQRKGLLSRPEIQALVTRRQDLEYKLRRVHIAKVDFLRAIEYELNLVALVARRREKLGIVKKGFSDFAAMRRIAFLYERALRKFHQDTGLWKQYLEYLRRSGSTNAISRVLPRAIQLNPKDTGLWLLHASWEMEHNNNVEGARTILQRALRLNNSAKDVWTAFFALEIRFIAKMLERRRRMGLIEGSAPAGAKKEESAATAAAGGDFATGEGVVSLKSAPAAPLDSATVAAGDLSRKQIAALFRCVLPRAIFKNACVSKGLREDLRFRLDFLRMIPSPLSAALSALPAPADSEASVAGEESSPMARLSLASFAYNHNGDDALLSAFVQYNGKTPEQIAREMELHAAAGAPVTGDEEDESSPRQSSHPYHVDFLPLCREILSSLSRDFPHEPAVVRVQAEFELIVRRLQRDGIVPKSEVQEGEEQQAQAVEDDHLSPAQAAFAVYEAALTPEALAARQSAGESFYRSHKQVLDAAPLERARVLHTPRTLWQEYTAFAVQVLKGMPEDEEVKAHVQGLYERVGFSAGSGTGSGKGKKTAAAAAGGVLTDQIVCQHADFLLETGQVAEALAVLEQALTPAAGSSAPTELSRSLLLWSRFLQLQVTLHAFSPSAAEGDDAKAQGEDSTAAAAHNGKKRKKASAASSASPSASAAPRVSSKEVLAHFERALSSVRPEDLLAVHSQLLAFHRAQLLAAARPSPSAHGSTSTGVVAAYLSVHLAYRRVIGLIPAPKGVDRVKEDYVNWMASTALGEVYTTVQCQAGAAKKQQPQSQHKSKKARKVAAVDSDDDDDALPSGLTWPAGVPSLALPPAMALRQLVDSMLAAPPVTLALAQAALRTEEALNPSSAVGAVAVAGSAGAAAAAATSSAAAAASSFHLRRMKDLFERCLLHFGSSSPDLWFSYLSWARGLGVGVGAGAGQGLGLVNPNQIHFRAARELKPEYQADWAELQTMLIQ